MTSQPLGMHSGKMPWRQPLTSPPPRGRGKPRKVVQLETAHLRSSGPWGKAKRLTPIQRQGKLYEKKFQQFVQRHTRRTLCAYQNTTLLSNPWIQFRDRRGMGWASPDLVLVAKDQVLVFECKRTRVLEAELALCNLYGPLVQRIWNQPTVLISVFNNFDLGHPGDALLVKDLDECLNSSSPFLLEWHWLPR